MVSIGIVVSLLPSQMTGQHRPHLSHIRGICIILEMPQQLIDIVEVHVIVVHLVVTVRVTTDIAIAIHLRSPLLLCSCQLLLGILGRMWKDWGDVTHLTIGIGIEMLHSPLVPSQHITKVTCAPACQRHAPPDTAMQPRLSVPVSVCCHHQCGS